MLRGRSAARAGPRPDRWILSRLRQRLRGPAQLACQAVALLAAAQAAAQTHPLDALVADEYREVKQILLDAGKASNRTVFARIHMVEPAKAEVLAWTPGDAYSRRARAVLMERSEVREVMLDLRSGAITGERALDGVQPGITFTDTLTAERLTRADRRWRAGIRARGFDDPDSRDIACLSLSAGYFAQPEYEGRRLLRVECYALAGITSNVYQRPIGRLSAIVDVHRGEVLRVYDGGADSPVPGPLAGSDYAPTPPARISAYASGNAAPAGLNPVRVTQPGGASFELDGSQVRWGPWRFHLRLDRQRGTVISLLRYQASADEPARSILYQGALSEMFVPYMDPTRGWYYKTFFDVGEFGFGLMATPLVKGIDCPAHATLRGGVMAFDRAEPVEYAGAVCLFERPTMAPVWRHRENINGTFAGAPGIELVIRMAAAVGNYDYVFDWVLMPTGVIRVDIVSTGIDNVQPVHAEHMDHAGAAQETRYGRLVAPGLVAPYHDHFFSLRLDFDVDGPANRFVRDRLVRERVSGDTPRRSLWRIEPDVAGTERDGTATIDLQHPALWRIEGARRNAVGNPSSYAVVPMGNAVSLLSPDAWPQRRAGFTDHHLWVTRFRPGETFAAGEFPNQSTGGAGLPAWVADDEVIEDTDLVAWYTLGFHHVTAAEDWPILPGHKASVMLKPHNFFDRNPTIPQ